MKAGPGSSAGPPSVTRGREIAFSVMSFVFGAGALGGLFGIGIVIGWFDTDEGGIHRVHELGFGVLYGIIVATAFFATAEFDGTVVKNQGDGFMLAYPSSRRAAVAIQQKIGERFNDPGSPIRMRIGST